MIFFLNKTLRVSNIPIQLMLKKKKKEIVKVITIAYSRIGTYRKQLLTPLREGS